MEGKFYAVIDTNVIVSAVISKSLESNPAKIIRAILMPLRTGVLSVLRLLLMENSCCEG